LKSAVLFTPMAKEKLFTLLLFEGDENSIPVVPRLKLL
jgi:hypothetical protein